MNLTYVRKYQRFLRKTQGIFYKNPLLSLGTCSAAGGHPFLRIDRHHRYFGSYARLLYSHRLDCQPAAQKGPAALARGFVPADFLPAADSIAHDGEKRIAFDL